MTSKLEKSSFPQYPSCDKLGVKHDQGKLRYDLVDPSFEEGLALVMTHGADKYGERNWEKGMKVSRLYAACRRHLSLFMSGEDFDVESNLHHLYHAGACLMMMRKLSQDSLWDDRGDVWS
jgi:hypothetical protein